MNLESTTEKKEVICLLCKFFDSENLVNTKSKKSFGCDHSPMNIHKKILMKSPYSRIKKLDLKALSSNGELFAEPIGILNDNENGESDYKEFIKELSKKLPSVYLKQNETDDEYNNIYNSESNNSESNISDSLNNSESNISDSLNNSESNNSDSETYVYKNISNYDLSVEQLKSDKNILAEKLYFISKEFNGSKFLQNYIQKYSEKAAETRNQIFLENQIFIRQKENILQKEDKIKNIYEKKIFYFTELLKNTLPEISMDSCGNYILQRLCEEKYLQSFLKENLFLNNVESLSVNNYGCRVVQKAIESFDDVEFFFSELKDNFLNMADNQSSNHVIQRLMDRVFELEDDILFNQILQLVFNNLLNLSQSKYGCRILQKILDIYLNLLKNNRNFLNKTYTLFRQILDKIVTEIEVFANDQYGNYTIQHILTIDISIKEVIIDKLIFNIKQYSKQKYSSNIIEKIILMNNPIYLGRIINEMYKIENKRTVLYSMTKDRYANYVIQQVFKICDKKEKLKIFNILKKHLSELKANLYSRNFIKKLTLEE